MEIGIKNIIEIKVTDKNTAATIGSGALNVFATPAMIALIEETAWKSVEPYLKSGESTVGTKLNISHISPTPIGMIVRCETELIEVNGRCLKFEANVYDAIGSIGKGIHERFIISSDKFQAKANSKLISIDK